MIKDMERKWMVVLPFPSIVTSILFLFSIAYCLKDEMINSLETIIRIGIIKTRLLFIKRSQIRTIETKSLSANKSNRAPNSVTLWVFLAM